MRNYFEQFKVEHIKEYLELSLEAFKQNSPRLMLGVIDDAEFLESTEKIIRLVLEI